MTRNKTLASLLSVMLALASMPAPMQAQSFPTLPNVDTIRQWHQCREYLPQKAYASDYGSVQTSACRVDYDMAQTSERNNPPQIHRDITIRLDGKSRGVVALWHSSPFAACTLSASGAPLSRNMDANIGSAVSGIGGLGAFGEFILGGNTPEVTSTVASSANLAASASATHYAMNTVFPLQDFTGQIQAMATLKLKPEVSEFLAQAYSRAKGTPKERADAAINSLKGVDQPTKQKLLDAVDGVFDTQISDDAKSHLGDLIDAAHKALTPAFEIDQDAYQSILANMKQLNDDIKKIAAAMKYAYPTSLPAGTPDSLSADDQAVNGQMTAVGEAASDFIGRPVPDPVALLSDMRKQVETADSTVSDLSNFLKKIKASLPLMPSKSDNDIVDSAQGFLKDAEDSLSDQKAHIDPSQANSYANPKIIAIAVYLKDTQPKIDKIMDFVKDWQAKNQNLPERLHPSVQILPIPIYPEAKVSVQVKCVDAVTSTPVFDPLQFTAYFQSPPQFDISSGAIMSSLHGRQVTTSLPYSNPATSSCPANPTGTPPTPNSSCPLIAVNKTRFQFMPGVFTEWHPFNFMLAGIKDPARSSATNDPPAHIPDWMNNGSPRHGFGYVGSFGFVGGLLVNPNNGTTQPEFFEGLSLGIQRFSILLGNHTGRSQNLQPGYTIGQPVATGTTVPFQNNWGNGLAFGLTYRIALR